jgi:hypothetical protein
MPEPEMEEWVSMSKPEDKRSYMLSSEMELGMDRFIIVRHLGEEPLYGPIAPCERFSDVIFIVH